MVTGARDSPDIYVHALKLGHMYLGLGNIYQANPHGHGIYHFHTSDQGTSESQGLHFSYNPVIKNMCRLET